MGIENEIKPAPPQAGDARTARPDPSRTPSAASLPPASIVISTPLPPRKAARRAAEPEEPSLQRVEVQSLRHDPDAIRRAFETGDYPYKSKVTEAHYVERMLPLQAELLKAQNWVKESGEKIVVLFEGRDAAGKGGTIKRSWSISTARRAHRGAGEPNARAGFCKPNEYLEFMRQCPELERMLVRSGIRLYKYWFSVTRKEQRRRFAARETDPLKQWKLSPIDKASLDKWEDYTEAKEAMFFNTDTADAPWTIVKSDDKKRARINCMQHFLSPLPYPNKDRHIVVGPDPLIVGSSALVIGAVENILETTLHPARRRR